VQILYQIFLHYTVPNGIIYCVGIVQFKFIKIKGAKIFLHVKSPAIRAKLKGSHIILCCNRKRQPRSLGLSELGPMWIAHLLKIVRS